MSRYRDDPRYSAGNLAYRDAPPPPQRWDRDRFANEQYERGPPRAGYEDPYRSPRRAPVYEQERERFYEDDRYGPRGNLRERKIYEEDDIYRDPRAAGGAMIPFRPERPSRVDPPPRPGLLRRQSSLDTFDRRPSRRYDDRYDDYPPEPRRPSRYAEYDDVRIQDPDRYGDDGFREYREREWISKRRRSGSRSRSRSRDRKVIGDVKEVVGEKTYPRRGKTRMPRRLVHTKVLYDLGYPYYEEDERTILIEKALGPENIDEVFTLSKEYREREVTTTRLIEAPPEPVFVHPPASVRGSVREVEIDKFEEITTKPISEAPRSVREWDHLSVRSPSPRQRSRSRRRSRRDSSPGRETIIEREEIREVSPARTHRTSRSHRGRDHSSHSESETIIEKTKIITEEADFEESNSVHVGPLALVVDRKPSRSDRDIKDEIRRLERERKEIRRERKYERDGIGGEIIKVERVRDRSPSPRGEVVVERRGDEILEVRKDRRARARSAAPSPGIIKAMFATLT